MRPGSKQTGRSGGVVSMLGFGRTGLAPAACAALPKGYRPAVRRGEGRPGSVREAHEPIREGCEDCEDGGVCPRVQTGVEISDLRLEKQQEPRASEWSGACHVFPDPGGSGPGPFLASSPQTSVRS